MVAALVARAVGMRRLGLAYGEPSYYRDIYVWLPDIRWGEEAMPVCINCDSAKAVSPHAFQTGKHGHCGRRICALSTHYFSISRRYICGTCELKANAVKAAAARAAAEAGLRVDEVETEDTQPQYTFMGYDQL